MAHDLSVFPCPFFRPTTSNTTLLLLRVLASFVQDCATADNYYCDDPTKKQYSEYLTEKGAECATNTDTLDCKGPMKGSNCKAGECCCHDDMNAFSGSYIPPASEAEMSSYNQCGDCSTEFPIKCPTKYQCDNYMIESDWDVAVVVIDPYYGVSGCEKCCGQIKEDMCTGREVQNGEQVQATKAIGSYVMYGALLVVVGVAPALLAAFGKLKQTDVRCCCCCCCCVVLLGYHRVYVSSLFFFLTFLASLLSGKRQQST